VLAELLVVVVLGAAAGALPAAQTEADTTVSVKCRGMAILALPPLPCLLSLLLLGRCDPSAAMDNGLVRTPPLGWCALHKAIFT
jgi:hypothetical protein